MIFLKLLAIESQNQRAISTKIGAFRRNAAQIAHPFGLKNAENRSTKNLLSCVFNALDIFVHISLMARKLPRFPQIPATGDGLYALTEDKQTRNRGRLRRKASV